MNKPNNLFDEEWTVTGTFTLNETAQHHFTDSTNNALNNQGQTLRSEAKEQEIKQAIDKNIRTGIEQWLPWDSERVLQPLYEYLWALLEWGDKKGAEAVIDMYADAQAI
jgi:hypothetical protein